MFKTLRFRILFYLLVASLSGIFLTSLSILWGFEEHFSAYLRENREKNISLIEEFTIQEYEGNGSLIGDRLNGLMHEQAMTENLFYQIYDAEGQLVADTTVMLGMMANMGMQSGSRLDKDYQSSVYDLKSEHKTIGSMKVFYPNSLLDEDFSFLKQIKQNIYIAIIVTVILSFLFSMLFSKRLSAGFNRLSKAVHELREHKWYTRVQVEDLTEELKPIGSSFNDLALSLSKEETLRKQFTADLAHELRTPLATLRSQIEAYQDGIWEPTPKRLQQSHDELMRLVRLVNELEKLLAAENPQIKLQKMDIEAGKMITHIENQFGPSFREKGVHLNISRSTTEHWFHADRDRVIQILTNIVNNALQYTPSGKNVEISIAESENLIGFSVKDEGIGIREEDVPYLYERFYRGEKSRDRKTGGIGIGLSIVKALVDAHKGEVKIESKLKIGTTVTVLFPKT
ncbi:sensor histidine kinase [Bacillus benzoevorans]|uniref:histidine kinase n=1 Tax=Bacillus benzoevorans TaxID=1456 RepID=A0A7X0HRF0_9BACI|nr:ATP-binding protein [Bacillus benzoevorans]MBB6444392.1 signal transduction histidine kinase [Bacillus benzoevorans]